MFGHLDLFPAGLGTIGRVLVAEEKQPWYAICCMMLAELEVQRTVRRAEMWAFTMALSCLTGSATIHTYNIGILDVLSRGEEGCAGPKEKDADLWINIWELLEECMGK